MVADDPLSVCYASLDGREFCLFDRLSSGNRDSVNNQMVSLTCRVQMFQNIWHADSRLLSELGEAGHLEEGGLEWPGEPDVICYM